VDPAIDKEQVQIWLEHYGAAVAQIEVEVVGVGAEALVDGLWLCAHREGDTATAHAQQIVAALWALRGDSGLWGASGGDGCPLKIAAALCAWGQRVGDDKCIEEAQRLFWQCWRDWEEKPAQCIELSFWVALLQLGSKLLYRSPERSMHIVVSRCVATLLNDYYDVEEKTFYTALDGNALDGTTRASTRLALEAVDALMDEAVRCGDGRLFDWGNASARDLATRAELDCGAADVLRLVALRSLRHRAAGWGIVWIERDLAVSSGRGVDARTIGLCWSELTKMAAAEESVSGALRF
jgi:hypothetical protein